MQTAAIALVVPVQFLPSEIPVSLIGVIFKKKNPDSLVRNTEMKHGTLGWRAISNDGSHRELIVCYAGREWVTLFEWNVRKDMTKKIPNVVFSSRKGFLPVQSGQIVGWQEVNYPHKRVRIRVIWNGNKWVRLSYLDGLFYAT